MNYFLEGLQGSGKSTLVRKLSEKYPGCRAVMEGDYRIVCYTQVKSENHDFYRQLENYEVYNGRITFEQYKNIVLTRYQNWQGDGNIFECSLLQNAVEDIILYQLSICQKTIS